MSIILENVLYYNRNVIEVIYEEKEKYYSNNKEKDI